MNAPLLSGESLGKFVPSRLHASRRTTPANRFLGHRLRDGHRHGIAHLLEPPLGLAVAGGVDLCVDAPFNPSAPPLHPMANCSRSGFNGGSIVWRSQAGLRAANDQSAIETTS
jgi:hypothetical protein